MSTDSLMSPNTALVFSDTIELWDPVDALISDLAAKRARYTGTPAGLLELTDDLAKVCESLGKQACLLSTPASSSSAAVASDNPPAASSTTCPTAADEWTLADEDADTQPSDSVPAVRPASSSMPKTADAEWTLADEDADTQPVFEYNY